MSSAKVNPPQDTSEGYERVSGAHTASQIPSEGSVTHTTPSGIEVKYTPKPKRMYEVRQPDIKFKTKAGEFESIYREWREVPSVTQVLGVLDKSAGLIWWAQKVGVEGVLELVKRGALFQWGGRLSLPIEWGGYPEAEPQTVVDLLVSEKISTSHQRDKAGDRGVAVHDAFETWAKTGQLPDPAIYPESEKGYVAGLIGFLEDVRPEPIEAEVMVGSVEHGFAGRYDIRLRVTKECNVVFHRTPKKGPQYARLKPGVYLADLKTSKGTYQESHGRQLEAYELASVECGYEPTVARGIIHVSADGTYEFVRSRCTADDFLAVLQVWRDNQRIKGAK